MVALLNDLFWPEPMSATNSSTVTMNSATYRVAWIFRAPKAGTIDKIGLRISAVAGNTMHLRILPVLSGGTPDINNLIAAGAEATFTPPTVQTTFTEIPLNTPPTVAKGDYIAVDLAFDTYANSTSIFAAGGRIFPTYSENGYSVATNGTTYNNNAAPPSFAVSIGGTYVHVPYLQNYDGVVNDSFSNGGTYDQGGLRFKAPWDCIVSGWWQSDNQFGAGNFEILDASNTSLISTPFTNQKSAANLLQVYRFSGNNTVQLAAGQIYRAIYRNTASSTAQIVRNSTYNSTALQAGSPGGVDAYRTARKGNAAAWTDFPTNVPGLGLILSDIVLANASNRYIMKNDGTLANV